MRRAVEDGQEPRAYLPAAAAAAQDLCARLDAHQSQLDGYRARVDAFFAECTAHIARIAEPLRDRTLLLELDALLEEGDRLDREVRAVVEDETAALRARMESLRNHLRHLAGDARVHTALAIPEHGGVLDVEILDDAIRALDVPADIAAQDPTAIAYAAQAQRS